MGRKKSCTPKIRELIVQCHQKEKLSMSAIAERFSCSKKMVFNAIQLYNKTKSFETPPRKPRTRKTTPAEDRVIVRASKKNPFLSSRQIKAEISDHISSEISTRTIRRRLQESGLRGCIAQKKPHVSKKNIKKRLQFAKEMLRKDPRFWNKVLWSDESKFNLFQSDGKTYVRRPPNKSLDPKYTVKTVKHGGGSIMVWGAFSWCGVGPIVRVQGKMDQHQYKSILENVMEPYSAQNMPTDYIFQHDNDPKHTSRLVKCWLSDQNIDVLDWPAQSPDLNPIENLWAIVKRDMKDKNPRNNDELFQLVQQSWESISVQICQGLITSLPKRLENVVKNKGYPTKY